MYNVYIKYLIFRPQVKIFLQDTRVIKYSKPVLTESDKEN